MPKKNLHEESTDSSDNDHGASIHDTCLSLMLKDDPSSSLKLMLYLKQYSELLFSWG